MRNELGDGEEMIRWNTHSPYLFLWATLASVLLLCLPLTPLWADASWERLPTDAEITKAWENRQAALDLEWSGIGKVDNFSFIKYHDPALVDCGHLESSGVLILYDIRNIQPQDEQTGEPGDHMQVVPNPDRESDPPFYPAALLLFGEKGWICADIRKFASPERRAQWVASLFANNPDPLTLPHYYQGPRIDRKGAAYARGFAMPKSDLSVELSIGEGQQFLQGDEFKVGVLVTRGDREVVENAAVLMRVITPQGSIRYSADKLVTDADGHAADTFYFSACTLVGKWTLAVTATASSEEAQLVRTFYVAERDISSAEVQQNLKTIARLWLESPDIPHGRDQPFIKELWGPKGIRVNLLEHKDARFAPYTCTMYTHRTLLFLNGIRFSVDKDRRLLMTGVDYGPISDGTGGIHSAVALYPSPSPVARAIGEEGWENGYVLEPWHNQRKEVWNAQLWATTFFAGLPIRPLELFMGNPYQGEYLTSGSKGGYFPGSTEQPRSLMGRTRFLTRSPVAVMLVDSQGRRTGRSPDGVVVNEIAGSQQANIKKQDGTFTSLIAVPDGQYQLIITGTGDGEFCLEVATDREIVNFDKQPIRQGEQAKLDVQSEALQSPLKLADGTLVHPRDGFHRTPDEIAEEPHSDKISSDPLHLPPLSIASGIPASAVTIPRIRDSRPRHIGMHATSADLAAAEAAGLDEVRGVVVKQVAPGRPAAAAGLQATDLIVKINDYEINDFEDLQAQLHTAQPGSRLTVSILRGRQARSLELPVALGDANAAPLGTYSFPGGGYQLDFLPGWKFDPVPRREEVTDRGYDYLESVQYNYTLFLYRDFEETDDPAGSLEAFRLRTSEDFLHGQSGWVLLDDIPAVFVAGVVGRERLHTLYRLAFVVQGRLFEVNAFTPPTNDPGRLPKVLEVTLGSIQQTSLGIPAVDHIRRLRQRAMEVWSPPLDPVLNFEEVTPQEMPPEGWTKSEHDPNKIVEIFRPLRLKPDYVLRAYTFREGDNANGIVWAMPEAAEFPEPADCPTLEHHLFQAPKPWGALDDVMEAIEGDGSQWSHLAASLLRRELREFGASWHGIQWGTHYVLEEDPWKKGLPKEDDFDLSRPSNPEAEWKWSEPKPQHWAPMVQVQPDRIVVTYYTYSGKETQRIFRHTETYRPGSYRARVQDQEIASGGWGYLF